MLQDDEKVLSGVWCTMASREMVLLVHKKVMFTETSQDRSKQWDLGKAENIMFPILHMFKKLSRWWALVGGLRERQRPRVTTC